MDFQFPRAVIPEPFLSLKFTPRNKTSDLGLGRSHKRLPCFWCRARGRAEGKAAGRQGEGLVPTGAPWVRETLPARSVEGEGLEGRGQARGGIVRVVRQSQKLGAAAAGG